MDKRLKSLELLQNNQDIFLELLNILNIPDSIEKIKNLLDFDQFIVVEFKNGNINSIIKKDTNNI